jgi:hypothetical protein
MIKTISDLVNYIKYIQFTTRIRLQIVSLYRGESKNYTSLNYLTQIVRKREWKATRKVEGLRKCVICLIGVFTGKNII